MPVCATTVDVVSAFARCDLGRLLQSILYH